MPLNWKIDECAAYHERLHLCGWCFQAAPRVVKIEAVFPEPAMVVPIPSFGQPSPDVAAAVDPAAIHARFHDCLAVPNEALGFDFTLRFTLADGTVVNGGSALGTATADDQLRSFSRPAPDHPRRHGPRSGFARAPRSRTAASAPAPRLRRPRHPRRPEC